MLGSASAIGVLKGVEVLERDVEALFELLCELHLVLIVKQDIHSVSPLSCGAACAVHETVHVAAPHLDHNIDVIDVQTSRCHVGTH